MTAVAIATAHPGHETSHTHSDDTTREHRRARLDVERPGNENRSQPDAEDVEPTHESREATSPQRVCAWQTSRLRVDEDRFAHEQALRHFAREAGG